ncbi:hypothetical protein OJ996_14805 [Luteolibacter sp. GHJ8]|uniref:Type II secretion system protein GspG C-terminal domain-containing protein n=1 Tax=Luteolibacter rhizosphaerae TaxID=2989719 RepID=A0ABT3G6J2_9BACT|nr:hypothetical protein [Luteolibacter rhizosphaerae]MCW1914855.1 hypothetical protein [Luteolibacter rhizosphaerae]
MRSRTLILSSLLLAALLASIPWDDGEAPAERAIVPKPLRKQKPATEIQILPEAAEIAARLHTPECTPAEDLETLGLLVSIFRRSNGGGNPAGGENDEIVGQLAGKNDKSFAVLPPKHPAISGGRLLDRWGTPYHFHPVGRDVLDLRSAGPDGKLWTPDDVFLESH